MSDARTILERFPTIVVVGLTADPAKPSHRISRYMRDQGYRIIGVNPTEREVFGDPVYPDLASVPEPVEFVNVFRRPEFCADVARSAVAVGASALWLQLGIASEEARRIAQAAGLLYIQDACVMVEHRRYGIGPVSPGT